MTRFALPVVLSLLALAACSVAAVDDDANDVSSDIISSKPKSVLFSADQRPVDGALTELRLLANKDGSYDATLHTQAFSRMEPHEIDNTKELGSSLKCTFSSDSVSCSRDSRPVDGALTEVRLVKSEDGKWDASVRTAYYDRLHGTPIDRTDEIAFGLKRQ